MRCTVCAHPKIDEIDLRLASGETLKDTAARYRLTLSALHRHKHHCKYKIRNGEVQAIRAGLTMDPSKITDAITPFRAEATANRLDADGLLTLASYVLEFAAQRAIALDDVHGMISVAREARELSAYALRSQDQRSHLKASRRMPHMAALENLWASEPDGAQAGRSIARCRPP